jgi:hypothetical protein
LEQETVKTTYILLLFRECKPFYIYKKLEKPAYKELKADEKRGHGKLKYIEEISARG